ncbi:hypothetical protein L195_g038340 [Trifolium pratense]|uniref:Uncharacterized protein n=1 Tax=Trifolium pratense TaxID=57577 RepID=A0A2K3LUU8_TRIPR|nr:hypothetical protein L195_g038340 [Trifolium pratense]
MSGLPVPAVIRRYNERSEFNSPVTSGTERRRIVCVITNAVEAVVNVYIGLVDWFSECDDDDDDDV